MIAARIFQPAKNAMQSGRANTKEWQLEYEPTDAKRPDPLMGWIGSGDTRRQVRLRFPTKEQAIAFAEENGLVYHVYEPTMRTIQPKSYADNFRRIR